LTDIVRERSASESPVSCSRVVVTELVEGPTTLRVVTRQWTFPSNAYETSVLFVTPSCTELMRPETATASIAHSKGGRILSLLICHRRQRGLLSAFL
jgi:hypothetical protein